MILGNLKIERANNSVPRDNKNVIRHESSTTAAVFDPFFGIKIACPRLSLEIFNSYCTELKKTRIGSLTASTPPNTIFMGVIVESTGIRKSANNKDYLIWHLSDLQSDQKIKLLIFGDAAQAHWKLQVGFTVAVTNAEAATESNAGASSSNYSKVPTFKIMKSLQVMSIGLCSDFGICTGQRKNGERCTNYVNTSLSPVCIYHIQTEAKKLRSFRGSLSAIPKDRPKSMLAISPQNPKHDGQLFTVNRPKLNQISANVNLFAGGGRSEIASRAQIGNKQLAKLSEMIEKEANQQTSKPLSAKPNLLPNCDNRQTSLDRIKQAAMRVGAPQSLGQSGNFINLSDPIKVQPKSQFSPAEMAARKRAAQIFNKPQSTDSTLRKRKFEEPEKCTSLLGGNKLTNDQIRQLLDKKSTHEREVNQADRETELRYFKQREVEEKIETHATSLMEIKNVDVVTCKTCDYTAVNLAQRCLELNHEHFRHKATKRFFKCKDCSTRTICYTLMPTKPCTQCACRQYIRVGMKDERKVKLREDLQLRGEERKYVNS